MSAASGLPEPRDRRGLAGFVLLFAALYGGYGALSPFLPAFLDERGLSPVAIARLLAAAMLVRLVAAPLFGRLCDRTGATRLVLSVSLGLAGAATLAFLTGHGFWPLIAVAIAQAVVTAPLAPLADALALAGAAGGRAFEYGWVRAAGSAAFIAMTVLTGQTIGWTGRAAGLWTCAALFGIGALAAIRVRAGPSERPREAHEGFRDLIRLSRFRLTILAAGLVIGAHAMHDAFAVILWTKAGLTPGLSGLLWSESVAAEIGVFLWLGPRLLGRIGPVRAIVLAALAGSLRWAVQSQTAWLPAMLAIQSLHGLSFALLHLACLALIEAEVPNPLRATALAVYGSVGLGLASAAVTLVAGDLYARWDAQAFLAMSGLSLAAVPVALLLDAPRRSPRAAKARI